MRYFVFKAWRSAAVFQNNGWLLLKTVPWNALFTSEDPLAEIASGLSRKEVAA